MKTAKNIALILMCVTLIATVAVGIVLVDRVLTLLMPSPPPTGDALQTPPSSSESVPPSAPSSVPPSSSTVPLHQCEFTIKGKTYAPTCDMLGYTVYTCECGEADYQDYVPSLGHIYGDFIVIPPTCTEDGCTQRTCSRCNQTERTDIVEAAHAFSSWTATETPERESRNCSVCGQTQLRSTVSGESWTVTTITLEDVGGFGHLQVEVRPTKNAKAQIHHIYVGFPDANIRFDYVQEYLLIYYTFNGEEQVNAIASNLENLTLQPIGTMVPGKPAAAS